MLSEVSDFGQQSQRLRTADFGQQSMGKDFLQIPLINGFDSVF